MEAFLGCTASQISLTNNILPMERKLITKYPIKRIGLKNHPLTKDKPDTKVVSVRISTEMYERLKRKADKNGTTINAILRDAVINRIENVLNKSDTD